MDDDITATSIVPQVSVQHMHQIRAAMSMQDINYQEDALFYLGIPGETILDELQGLSVEQILPSSWGTREPTSKRKCCREDLRQLL